jgi:hypothetical protein
LSPDPFALQYRDIVQNLLKDLIWQKRIWGQATKRLDFGARKCIGGTASLTKKMKKASSTKHQAGAGSAVYLAPFGGATF